MPLTLCQPPIWHNLSMCRPLTKDEVVIQGLLGQSPRPKLRVVYLGSNGRGVAAAEPIAAHTYVCEYRTYRVYPVGSALEKQLAEEYATNSEDCYVIRTAYRIPDVGRLCFDATRRYRDVGRLINHSATPNLQLTRPFYVRGKWRVALIAKTDIRPEEEVTYDYGVRTLTWMKKQTSSSHAVKHVNSGDGRPDKEVGKKRKEGRRVAVKFMRLTVSCHVTTLS